MPLACAKLWETTGGYIRLEEEVSFQYLLKEFIVEEPRMFDGRTDGSDAVIEISDSDETLPPSDKQTQPPLEECGQEVEWSQSP
ncbi:hypothetical protein DPMN_021133 [Dreissena polymorpha]|uniref:Uncharacterized protein n=1 Tax=Dreissena polymorpha TaxID=45954 RepID=A0A9D4NNA5_DREPO|nr:hypothetical protein DPMN_021133 [Dreissena polymorpha]